MNLNGYEFLKDRLNSDIGKNMINITNKLEKVADNAGIPLVNLVLGWCLQNKNVSTVILGASNTDQLRQNLATIDYLEQFDDSLMKISDADNFDNAKLGKLIDCYVEIANADDFIHENEVALIQHAIESWSMDIVINRPKSGDKLKVKSS